MSAVKDAYRKVCLITLGCPKNEVDSDVLGGILKKNGFKLVDDAEKAEIILINTCGFIEDAKQESIDTILSAVDLKTKHDNLKLYVWGCLSERYKKEIAGQIPEVDAFFGVEAYEKIGKQLLGKNFQYSDNAYKNRIVSTYPHTAYLKIADGCDHRCSFCVIPKIKGNYRSRDADEIIREAEMLAHRGVKELTLVAQDTTAYGSDLGSRTNIVMLLKRLAGVKNIEWIRLLYAFPGYISEDLIRVIADEPKICNYMDVPFQHISDMILKAMRREPGKERIKKIIKKMRNEIPGLVLRTAFIVGFPGETENEFRELEDFIEEVKFERLGVFLYSPEESTEAYTYECLVPKETAVERYNRLMDIQNEISSEINDFFMDKTIKVLIDGYDENAGLHFGRTEGDALEIDQTVWVRGEVKKGEFYQVKIDLSSAYDLEGEMIK